MQWQNKRRTCLLSVRPVHFKLDVCSTGKKNKNLFGDDPDPEPDLAPAKVATPAPAAAPAAAKPKPAGKDASVDAILTKMAAEDAASKKKKQLQDEDDERPIDFGRRDAP